MASNREREASSSAYLKMRSDYRASLAEKPLELDAADFVDSATKKILNGPRLVANQKLTVKVPRWTGTPAPTFSDVVTLLLDKDDGAGFVEVGTHTFTRQSGKPDFDEVFPYAMDIRIGDLPRDANCALKYRIDYYNDSEDESTPQEFLCDHVKPYNGEPPAALTLDSDLLDDNNLPVGGQLTLTIPPGYSGGTPKYDWKAGDVVAIYLVDANNIPPDLSLVTPLHFGAISDPGTTGAVLQVDANKVRALGDLEGVFLYVIRDKSLNDSVVSLWTKVSMTLGPLPTPLDPPEVPQADPGPLLVEHALDGVSVWINRNPAFKSGDVVELTWGSTEVWKDFVIPINANPKIEIPVAPTWIMLTEYGQSTKGEKDTAVSYRVFRKGRPFGPANATIKVNFEVAIPWLPWPPEEDWPIPSHPELLKGEVQNHDKTKINKLERDDKNQKAFFTFEWYKEAINGHVVDFYWNGQRIVEAQLTFDDTAAPGGPGHAPGDEVTVEVPWEYIKAGGNSLTIPVGYSISAPGLENDLFSEITEVDVNAIAVELPPASFPSVTGSFPNCNSLEPNGDLRVKIPDLSALLKVGDKIRAVFTPMKGEDGPEDPISGAEYDEEFELVAGNITGFEFLVTPYDDHIKPLYDETSATNRRGRMKIQYFFNDGSEDVPSESLTRLTAFHDGSASCPIPRP